MGLCQDDFVSRRRPAGKTRGVEAKPGVERGARPLRVLAVLVLASTAACSNGSKKNGTDAAAMDGLADGTIRDGLAEIGRGGDALFDALFDARFDASPDTRFGWGEVLDGAARDGVSIGPGRGDGAFAGGDVKTPDAQADSKDPGASDSARDGKGDARDGGGGTPNSDSATRDGSREAGAEARAVDGATGRDVAFMADVSDALSTRDAAAAEARVDAAAADAQVIRDAVNVLDVPLHLAPAVGGIRMVGPSYRLVGGLTSGLSWVTVSRSQGFALQRGFASKSE